MIFLEIREKYFCLQFRSIDRITLFFSQVFHQTPCHSVSAPAIYTEKVGMKNIFSFFKLLTCNSVLFLVCAQSEPNSWCFVERLYFTFTFRRCCCETPAWVQAITLGDRGFPNFQRILFTNKSVLVFLLI